MTKRDRPDGLFTIDPEDVAAAMRAGFSFVCSMCVKLHAGKEAHGTRDWKMVQCLGNECGGPMGGRGYPEYHGPLGAVNLPRYCFRCGREPDAVVESHKDRRMVGACEPHLELLHQGGYESRPAGTERPGHRHPLAEFLAKQEAKS